MKLLYMILIHLLMVERLAAQKNRVIISPFIFYIHPIPTKNRNFSEQKRTTTRRAKYYYTIKWAIAAGGFNHLSNCLEDCGTLQKAWTGLI